MMFQLFAQTRCDHDLVLLGAHAQEGQVILGVDVSYGAPGLHHQLVDQCRVLHRAGVVQGRLDGDSWRRSDIKYGLFTL